MGCQLPQGAKALKDFRLVESQNHRTVWAGKGLWTAPLTRQGDLQQVTQECSKVGFGIRSFESSIVEGRLHNLPGQTVPLLCHPQRSSSSNQQSPLGPSHVSLPAVQSLERLCFWQCFVPGSALFLAVLSPSPGSETAHEGGCSPYSHSVWECLRESQQKAPA